MKITLQECIFLIATVSKKQSRILSQFSSNYIVPLKVNGKDMSDPKKSEEMKRHLEELNILSEDLLALKNALTLANNEHKINEKTLATALEEVRIKRNLLSALETALSLHSHQAESGVGIVQYGVMNEELVKEKFEALEKEVFALSKAIDLANASITIEILLQGEY